MTKEYKGYNGIIILDDKSVTIKRGLRGILLGGGFLRGDKTIPFRVFSCNPINAYIKRGGKAFYGERV